MIESIWYEKYAPQTIDDVILPENVKNKFKKYISDGKLPNLGFWSSEPGLGKSSTAKALIRSMNADALFVNASMERGIDVLKSKIMNFASTESLTDSPKIVVMDECLEENEKVLLLDNNKIVPTKLNALEKGKVYECISFNMETGKYEHDTCEVVSDKSSDIYEVELEDGRKLKVTDNHPFIVRTSDGKFIEKSIKDGLSSDDDIVCLTSEENTYEKVKSITKISPGRVINLTVHKNHTFVAENGIVTHNCDNMLKDVQASWRGFIDSFHGNCSFIFTGNYKSKIIEPLLDRLENYEFVQFPKEEMVKPIFEKLKYIAQKEELTFDDKQIGLIIKEYYPRIRGMIGALQRSAQNGQIVLQGEGSDFSEVISEMRAKNYLGMVEKVNALPNPDAMYEFLYKNLGLFQKLPNAIVTIAKYQYQNGMVRDKNLNLSACLTELTACL